MEITRSIAAFGRTFARSSKFTVANAIWPSGETACAPAGEYGLTTPVTCGSACDLREHRRDLRAHRRFGDRCRCVAKTIWSESPDCAGKSRLSRSTARCESVPGSEKLLL